MNKFDEFVWVKKVIKSCKTLEQLSSSDNLISIYLEKWKDDDDYYILRYDIDVTYINYRNKLENELLKP